MTITNSHISISYRPAYAGFFYNISLRKKNGVKLTKVNNFSYNTLTINHLLLNNNNFQLMAFPPFSGYLRQYLTILPSYPVNPLPFYSINLVTSYPSPSVPKIRPIPARVLKNICEIFADYQSVINGDEKFLMIFLAQTGVKYTFAVPKKIVVGAPTAEIQARQAIKSKFNIQNETP